MFDLSETATFRGDDAVCLVEASLACRVCLSGDVDWSMRSSEWDVEVICRCGSCGDVRSIGVNGEQALRLSVDRQLVEH